MHTATAERRQEDQHSAEEYGRSTKVFDRWGGARAVGRIVTLEKYKSLENLVYANYTSGLREMLATDEHFRPYLDIDDRREHSIINDQVCDAEGTPMAEVIREGRKASERRAQLQPDFNAVVIRDIGDEIVAARVDKLKPGQVYITRSMEPVKELKNYTKTYRDLGYREGLAYDQYYAKVDKHTLVAGSYSVDMSDELTYRQQRAKLGFPLPEGATPNTIIRYGFEISATPKEAERFVRALRADHYKRRGATKKRYSISEYLEQNDEIVRGFFDIYYLSLAQARNTGQNNEIMQDLALTVLKASADKLKPEVRQNLMSVAKGQTFNKNLAQTMDDVVRYAVVEELRKGLPAFIGQSFSSNEKTGTWPTNTRQNLTNKGVSVTYTNQLLANNISTGVRAGRAYGGCSATELADESQDTDGLGYNHSKQEAYGGKGKICKEIKNGDITNCPHCKKKNVRAIVPKAGGKVYCDNPTCELAAPTKKSYSSTTEKRWTYSYNK